MITNVCVRVCVCVCASVCMYLFVLVIEEVGPGVPYHVLEPLLLK